MYSYKIWDGCYSDYYEKVIYHVKKFSESEFIAMFNKAVEKGNHDCFDVADYLIEHYGFSSKSFTQQVFEVGARYSPLKKIIPDTGKSEPEENENFRTRIF